MDYLLAEAAVESSVRMDRTNDDVVTAVKATTQRHCRNGS